QLCKQTASAAIHHITQNKNHILVSECLKLLYHLFNKANSKQKEDMMDKCVETVLKALEGTDSEDITINSSLILKEVILIENEKLELSDKARITNAAAVHMKCKNPDVLCKFLDLTYLLLSKADTQQKENIVDLHFIKVVLDFVKKKKRCDEDDELHKSGWDIFRLCAFKSKKNSDSLVASDAVPVILQYLK
ncbi:unnamed protein product, partial [Meganyctiphanes norvegica]